tara:strand:+ start:260 stop:1021 length:762 start_codon:yes stop_codon:yes gene_type:complete
MEYIAEIGVNHLGSEDLAIKYCQILSETKTTGITLQIREKEFYDKSAPWKNPLSKDCYLKCNQIVKNSGKSFGLAVADLEVAQTYNNLLPDFWKILSWGIKDSALINFLLSTNHPVHVSTGISDIKEIISVSSEFNKKVNFIHTQLSTDIEDVNLSAISTIREATGCPVSFGLHCNNMDVMSLSVIFKPHSLFFYVKERTDVDYPDGTYAVLISDLDATIDNINILSSSIGDGMKTSLEAKTLIDENKPDALK